MIPPIPAFGNSRRTRSRRMDRTARNILVILLFVAFFISAPAVLLYTSGYGYSFARNQVLKTGILHVESIPRGADVLVNGKSQNKETPLTVNRLLPGRYDVKIVKKGYHPWEKRLQVRSGQTTFAKDVVLIPDGLPRLVTRLDGTNATWSVDAKRVAFVSENDAWTEVMVHDVRTNATSILARYAADTYDDITLEWSPDGGTLAVSAVGADDGLPKLFLYDTSDDVDAVPVKVTAVHDSLADIEPDPPSWTPDGKALIVAAGGVYSADPATGKVVPYIVASDVTDVAVSGNDVWTVRDGVGGPVLERRQGGPNGEVSTVASLPKGNQRFVNVGHVIVMADPERGSGVIVDPSTGDVTQTAPFTKAVPQHPDGSGSLLLCGEFELAILGQDAKLPGVVTRVSEPVVDCGWHPEGTYVFYATSKAVTAIEIDSRDRRNTYNIADFDSIDAMIVDPEAMTLRFLGTVGSQHGLFESPL